MPLSSKCDFLLQEIIATDMALFNTLGTVRTKNSSLDSRVRYKSYKNGDRGLRSPAVRKNIPLRILLFYFSAFSAEGNVTIRTNS